MMEEAAAINKAVDTVLDLGYRTADLYSDGTEKVGCKKMAELICANL